MSYDLYVEKIRQQLSESLRDGTAPETIQAEYTQRLKSMFPKHPLSASKVIEQLISGLTKGEPPQTPTVNIINITNSFNAPAPGKRRRATRAKAKRITLNFRLIADDSLSIDDRLILSLVWKWQHQNSKRQSKGVAIRPVTVRRLRATTGLRWTTIGKSLMTLAQLDYLSPAFIPNESNPNLRGYRKLNLTLGSEVLRSLFAAMKATSAKTYRAGWWRKSLGISRATFYRWDRAATDETKSGYR